MKLQSGQSSVFVCSSNRHECWEQLPPFKDRTCFLCKSCYASFYSRCSRFLQLAAPQSIFYRSRSCLHEFCTLQDCFLNSTLQVLPPLPHCCPGLHLLCIYLNALHKNHSISSVGFIFCEMVSSMWFNNTFLKDHEKIL